MAKKCQNKGRISTQLWEHTLSGMGRQSGVFLFLKYKLIKINFWLNFILFFIKNFVPVLQMRFVIFCKPCLLAMAKIF